jgi:ABC-2 type transport system permease protein
MHAEAGVVTHSQGFAHWSPRDSQSFDLPSAVVAHEMAHEWTPPYAFVEGAPVMSEGLAWYAGIQLIRNRYGPDQLAQLLHFMRQPYPHAPIRRGEPLIRGLDPYMSYRRAPFALFALSEYFEEGKANAALRRLFEQHRSGEPPLVTTLDLYRELQAVSPDSLRPLMRDLFEVNAYWRLETERVEAEETSAGTWQVTLDVRARKMMYDSAGVETELPVNEWFEVGVFGAPKRGRDELSAPLYVQKRLIRSGKQTITVTLHAKPALAGIDSRHLLDWEERDDDDNIAAVKIQPIRTSRPTP